MDTDDEIWVVYDCPQCGEQTFNLHEGYCKSCYEDNQRSLDAHNAAFDRWERLTVSQRDAEIKAATRRS